MPVSITLTRRNFLRVGTLAGVAATASACSAAGRQVQRQSLPELVAPVSDKRMRRLLNRAGYGPTPESLSHVSTLGFEAYLEEQLNPEAIDDKAALLFTRNLSLYQMDIGQLMNRDADDIGKELMLSTFLWALYSKRQLYEAMVEFWSDHFTIYIRKDKQTPMLKLIDDREVIRPNALGTFRDLLHASAHSPAMLHYLDNTQNVKAQPNENYARELMELHTLSIDGGYTQEDVQELARALTGWTVAQKGRKQGKFVFEAEQHDTDPKTILGCQFDGTTGQQEVIDMLDVFAAHPSTAQFISKKLVRRFVADDPPQTLVDAVAQSFLDTGGDIKNMLRTIFLSYEFANAPTKIKRPFTFLVSTLRAFNGDVGPLAHKEIGKWLDRMGQVPFLWPMPDGYPDTTQPWLGNLLMRWKFGARLFGEGINGIHLPIDQIAKSANLTRTQDAVGFFHTLLIGEVPTSERLDALTAYVESQQLNNKSKQRFKHTLALMIASPEFQNT